MSTIDKIDLTDANSLDYLSSNVTTPFQLTDYTDGTSTLELAGGRSEGIGNYLYEVNDGDFTIITAAASSDGTWYVHVLDGGGGGIATAYLSSIAGTWDANLGGYYYSGAKVIMSVEKSGSNWNGRVRRDHKTNDSYKIGSLINFTDDNYGTDGVITPIYEYDNAQTTSATTATKILDIQYRYAGKIYIDIHAIGEVISSGVETADHYIILYKNGTTTGNSFMSGNGGSVGTHTVPLDLNGIEVDSTPSDNWQIYAYSTVTAGSPTIAVKDPSITIGIKDIFGTFQNGTAVL